MSVARWNIQLERRFCWRRKIKFADGDGVAIDLTDYEARMEIKPGYGEAALHEFTSEDEDSRIVITAATGEVEITLGAADIEAIAGRQYVHNIILVEPEGCTFRKITGTVEVVET
jgi:hypothetical protein